MTPSIRVSIPRWQFQKDIHLVSRNESSAYLKLTLYIEWKCSLKFFACQNEMREFSVLDISIDCFGGENFSINEVNLFNVILRKNLLAQH